MQRTSGLAANKGGMDVLEENGERIFRAVQPHIDPVERDIRSFVLENMGSHEALAFGAHDVSRGPNPVLAHQCNQLRDGCDVLIFVISVTGLTTNFGSLRLFVRNLVQRRGMRVSLFFWPQDQHPYGQLECRRFTMHFRSILEGRLGWGVSVPAAELIKLYSVDPVVWGMLEAFGKIDSVKAGARTRDAAPKNRNLLRVDVRAAFACEDFFAALFRGAQRGRGCVFLCYSLSCHLLLRDTQFCPL